MKINDVVNNYKILSFLKEEKGTYTAYKARVQCLTCGHEKTIGRGSIKTQGCKQGPCHPNFIDLSNKKIGNLKVIEFVRTENKYRKWRWRCICNCGRELLIPQSHIQNGQRACKRCTDKKIAAKKILPDNMAAVNRVIKQYKNGALNRNIEFKLSKKEVLSLIYQDCYYCNTKPKEDSNNLIRNGIDRLDSNLDYSVDNCVTCCSTCNTAKSNMTQKEFYNWIQTVYNNITKERSETIPKGSTFK